MLSVEFVAGKLYEKYRLEKGSVDINGDILPTWEELSKDNRNPMQYTVWIKVAEEAINMLLVP